MSALALDIGSYTIKALSAKPAANLKVERVVEIFNTTGIAVPTDDAQVEQLGNLIGTLIADHKLPTGEVRLALPEASVSTKVISIPRLSDAELASAIGWQAEQYIPIPPEELSLEYQVLYRPDKSATNEQMRVLLIGARKPMVEKYLSVFYGLGIEPKMVETQILSVVRSLGFEKTDPTTLVAHIGASSMVLSMVHEGELAFVFNHMGGGQSLTKSLEQSLGLTAEQAEQYKREYGLEDQQFQGKIKAALLPSVQALIQEMQKAIRFFINQYPTASVQRVLLSGGTAQLPGLAEVVTQALGAEVLVAAPFATAQGTLPTTDHPSYSVCAGLLLRQE
ncbi:MAG TPA: type IV pilus assembly protein PilM [Patescibacteria group bacterium]